MRCQNLLQVLLFTQKQMEKGDNASARRFPWEIKCPLSTLVPGTRDEWDLARGLEQGWETDSQGWFGDEMRQRNVAGDGEKDETERRDQCKSAAVSERSPCDSVEQHAAFSSCPGASIREQAQAEYLQQHPPLKKRRHYSH